MNDLVARRQGTSFAEDVAVGMGTIAFLEGIKFAFGWKVSLAVAIISLLAVLTFLYRAGCKAQARQALASRDEPQG